VFSLKTGMIRMLALVELGAATVLCGCVGTRQVDAAKRTLPPMPALAVRPVTAKAVLRGEKKAVLKEFELAPVTRADGGVAFTVKLSDLVPGVKAVEVRSPLATAKKGDAGYALCQRGLVFEFNKDALAWLGHRGWLYMPYYAMKTPHDTFIAVMEGMRFEHDLKLDSAEGAYAMYPSWNIAEIGFPPYEDMTVVFYQLPLEAYYNEMAKVYRSYKFAHDPAVRTLKERIKDRPELQKLADSIALRQTHAVKPWHPQKNKVDFTAETEPPVRTYRTYDETLGYLKQLKQAGVENVALCVAGWQTGGYDGRCPATFPVEEGPGGEAGIRRLCEGGRALGYIVDAHANYTDCFTCSPLWNNGDIACLGPNGTRECNGAWSGGKAYNLCLKHAWKTFLPGDLEKVSKLGFQGCHYIDVFSAVQPYRCCDPKHPANKKEQMNVQIEVAKRCQQLFGGFASECGMDHMLGYMDYINYVCAPMRAKRQAKSPQAYAKQVERFVPFFELAFHDVVLSNPDKITQEVLDQDHNLILVEYGGRPIFYGIGKNNFEGIVKAWQQFKGLRHLMTEEMVRHHEISPGIVRVDYANGESIVVNHSDKPFAISGVTVPVKDFRLLAKDN